MSIRLYAYIVLCFMYIYIYIYIVIQEESAIIWEMIVCVILSKNIHMNMGLILNGYRDNITTNITCIII
jgi:hypothetical protein